MSAKLAASFALVILCVLAVQASFVDRLDYSKVQLVPLSSVTWRLTHVSTVYRWQDDSTEFTYSVSTGASDLGHVFLVTSCLAPANLLSKDWAYQHHPVTGQPGIRHLFGQDANTVKTYTLRVRGAVNVNNAGSYILLGGMQYATGSPMPVPDCTGTAINGVCTKPADMSISCAAASTLPPASSQPHFLRTERIDGPCIYTYTILNFFRQSAGNNNAFNECVQKIEVADDQAPTSTMPDNSYIQLSCSDPVPPVPQVNFTDNCDPNPTVSYCEEIKNGSCPNDFIIIRTWTSTDACGNSRCITQTIARIDLEAPALVGVPGDMTFECAPDLQIPGPPLVTANDHGCDCFLFGGVRFSEVRYPGDCPDEYTLVRSWNITDCCGNFNSSTQVITVLDTRPPVLATPQNSTTTCDVAMAPASLSAFDSCAGALETTSVRTRIDFSTCPAVYMLQDLYTAVDRCGNMAMASAFIMVTNPFPITWNATNIPRNLTVECGHVPAAPVVVASHPCLDVSVTMTERQIPGPCPSVFTVIRTWVASHQCNSTLVYVQQINVIDTFPPKLDNSSLPSVGPFQCPSEVPSIESLVSGIRFLPSGSLCPEENRFTYNVHRVNGSCINDFRLVLNVDAINCVNLTDHLSRVIIVKDTMSPVLHNVPSNLNVSCEFIPPPSTTVTATDNCDLTVPVSMHESKLPGSCPGAFVVVRVWTAVDACSNSVSATQSIFVHDNIPPFFNSLPGALEVPCHAVPPKLIITANDTCTVASVDSSIPDEHVNGSCANDYFIIRRWVASDLCGNTVTHTQTLHVVDKIPPVFNSAPNDTDASCLDIPPPGEICVSDNCVGIKVSFSEQTLVGDCVNGVISILVRRWVATDACGNTATHVASVRILDSEVPVLPQQPDLTMPCDNVTLPPPPTPSHPCLNVTLQTAHTTVPGSCPQQFTLRRNFRAVDTCGRSTWMNYSIHVIDVVPPVLLIPPDMLNQSCVDPPVGSASATDNCDTAPSVTGPFVTRVNGTCPYEYTLLREWRASDACGNSVSATQTISVKLHQGPRFTSPLPTDLQFECFPDTARQVTAVDECGAIVPVMFTETNSSSRCPLTIVRVWRATDVCGRSISHTQTVVVNDVINPSLSQLPGQQTVECVAPLPPSACATDNCPGLDMDFEETVSNFVCNFTYDLLRKWTVRDQCGNTVTGTQVILVRDNSAPVFSRPGFNQTFECLPQQIAPPTATDNCGTVMPITNVTTTIPGIGSCHSVRIVYTARDLCGNVATLIDEYRVVDNSPPTLSFTPPLTNISNVVCRNIPPFPVVNPSDNCGATLTRLSDVVENTTCPWIFTLRRSVSAVDVCGNSVTALQIIQGVHVVPPSLIGFPANTSVPCETIVPVAPVTCQDECGNLLAPGFSSRLFNGSCPGEFTELRTWTCTDICGLSVHQTQMIRYFNPQGPIPSPLAPVVVINQCVPPVVEPPTANTSCAAGFNITVSNATFPGVCDLNFSQIITYTITDDCGRSSTVQQLITAGVTTPPTIQNLPPSLVSYPCDAVLPAPVLFAVDVCGNRLPTTLVETRQNGSCPNAYTLTRVWTAVDQCGLRTSFVQQVQVSDHEVPTLIGVPGDKSVMCGFVPCPTNVSATDNCPGVSIDFLEIVHNSEDCCNYTVERRYIARDVCGNSVTATQFIHVFYNLPPILIVPPSPPCIPCENFTGVLPPANVTAFAPPLAVGVCVNPTISNDPQCSPPSISNSFDFVYNGNTLKMTFLSSSQVVQYVIGNVSVHATLQDQNGKQYSLNMLLGGRSNLDQLGAYQPPRDLNPSCYSSDHDPTKVDPSSWGFYPSLSGSIVGNGLSVILAASNSHPSQFGVGANGRNREFGATLFVSYSDRDSAKSAEMHMDVRPEGEDCVFDHTKFPQLQCNVSLPITTTVTRFNGSCPQNFFFNRTFCVEWPFHPEKHICASQIIEICDTNKPQIQIPGSQVLECPASPEAISGTATDLCDEHPELIMNERKEQGNCPGNYTLIRSFLARDACGNTNTAESTIQVRDTIPPVIIGMPSTGGTVFCFEPATPAITVSDACGIDTTIYPQITRTKLPAPPGVPKCPHNYILRITAVAVDLCGHRVEQSFDTLILNNRPPVLHNVPENLVINCTAALPVFSVTASSECEGALTPNVTRRVIAGVCGQQVIITTWTATDACGQSVSAQQQTTIINPFPPTFNEPLPANASVDCNSVPPVPTLTASSLCGTVNVTFAPSRINGSCPSEYTLVRTWTAVDCLGRSLSHTQYIFVHETQGPTITPASPAFVNAACDNVPLPPDVCAEGQCPGLDMDFHEDRVTLQPNPRPDTCPRYQLTRTWIATTDCGRQASTSQVVRVFDDAPPACSPAPPNKEIDCLDQSVPPAPICRDDCSNVTMTLSVREFPGPQPCEESVIRSFTWVACDACDNCVTLQTNYTVVITVPPAIELPPEVITLECMAPQPITSPNATDVCFPHIEPIVSENNTNGSCPNLGTTTLTFTAINPCGLEAISTSVTIEFVDTTPPEFVGQLPQNTSAPCDAIPSVPQVSASDNCGPVTISFSTFNISGACPNNYTIIRRWVISDCTGHTVTHVQSIRIFDNQKPSLTFPAGLTDQNAACNNIPLPPEVCGSDNCLGLDIQFREVRHNLSSNPQCARFQLNRTWELIDACANKESASQVIRIFDITPPACPLPPAPITLPCENASQVVPTQPQCIDDCSGVLYTPLVINKPGPCSAIFQRTFAWKVEDSCGNFVWWNQTFMVIDITPPSFTSVPPNRDIPCDQLAPVERPTASHPCTLVNLTMVEFNNSQPNQCQNYTVLRVWTATDECGLRASFTQTIRVSQTRPPVFTSPLPQNMTLGCTDNFTAPIMTASDVCGPVIVTSHTTELLNDGCSRLLRIDYLAENLCGLSVSHTFYVRFTDSESPVLTPPEGFSSSITEQCNATSLPPAVCCEDNCIGLKMRFNETKIAGSCPGRYTLLRQWTCADRCGNFATLTQLVNVVDNTPPHFITPLPPNQDFECRNGSSPQTLVAVDNCGSASVNMTEQIIQGQCSANFTIIRRYIATDECGLQTSFTQTVNVRQTTPPLTNRTTPLCFTSETMLDNLVIRNLTVPNNFFPAADLCTPIVIHFVSCTSDEDAELGSGCTYNASTDQLFVSSKTTTNPLGRLYTVRALIINECGLSTPTSRQIFVPFNRTSITLRGFPFSPEECVPIKPECPQNCPCQVMDHVCEEGSQDSSLQYVSTSPNSAAGTTTFTYKLVLGASGRPNRVLIGLDLTQYELVSVNPSTNVTLGWQTGTYVKGIAWNDASVRPSDTYSFTIRGIVQEAAIPTATLPYLMGGLTAAQDSPPAACSRVLTVRGPGRGLSVSYSGASLSGRVIISGARFGTSRQAMIGVHDVPIALLNAQGAMVGVTLTDLQGGYIFHNVPAGASSTWKLAMLEDGILRPALRSSGNFLRTNKYDILGENDITGPPHALSSPMFSLLLDDQEQPLYNRLLAFNTFEGNSYSVNFWRYELQGQGELYADYSQTQFNEWRVAAQNLLLPCTANLYSNDPLEANLAAAALNQVSGRGFFAPYLQLQGWYMRFAQYVFCNNVQNSADRALALRFVQMINGADDIQAAVSMVI